MGWKSKMSHVINKFKNNIDNIVDIYQNSFSILKHSNAPENSFTEYRNIHFQNNNIYSN
jgi:hypothetical protein